LRSILDDINAVQGVLGSFVCGESGELLAAAMPARASNPTLQNVARTIALTLSGIQRATRRTARDVDLSYAEGRIVLRSVRKGTLCILCVPQVSVALLDMTTDLAVKQLRRLVRDGGYRAAEPGTGPSLDAADNPGPAGETPAGSKAGLGGFVRPFRT
jgi:predicted regulator of Ras-like GTPase activity (Roadblock/LC7/MglB family)